MSKKTDFLIVSPANVKFHSPFPHVQKRQLNLLNVSDQAVSYCLESSNEAMLQVLPCKGRLAAFDTTELTILMQPTQGDVASCSLTVRHRVQPETQLSEADAAADWHAAHTKQLKITLQNCVETEEMMRMFGFDGKNKTQVVKTMKQTDPQICPGCSQKHRHQQAGQMSWLQLRWSTVVIVALSILALAWIVRIHLAMDTAPTTE